MSHFDGREMPKPPGVPRKKSELHTGYMMDALARLEWDMHNEIGVLQRIPTAWRMIWAERHQHRKKRITIGIDENVLKFFKSMGTGYQTRINDVLEAFMHARLAGFLEMLETPPAYRDVVREQPQWGDTQRDWDKNEARAEAYLASLREERNVEDADQKPPEE